MYLHGWQCSEIKLYVPHRRLTNNVLKGYYIRREPFPSVFRPGGGSRVGRDALGGLSCLSAFPDGKYRVSLQVSVAGVFPTDAHRLLRVSGQRVAGTRPASISCPQRAWKQMWRKTGKHVPDGVSQRPGVSPASALGQITRKHVRRDRDCLPNPFHARQEAEGNVGEGKTSGTCGGRVSPHSLPGWSVLLSDSS